MDPEENLLFGQVTLSLSRNIIFSVSLILSLCHTVSLFGLNISFSFPLIFSNSVSLVSNYRSLQHENLQAVYFHFSYCSTSTYLDILDDYLPLKLRNILFSRLFSLVSLLTSINSVYSFHYLSLYF